MSTAADRLQDLLRPTGEEDLLAVQYPTPRVSVTAKQAVAAVAVVLLLVGGWWFLRSDSRGEPPQVQWEAAADSSEAPEQLVVSVVGEVDRPGLASLPPGSRVADALDAAHPREGADLLALNLAQLLVDGQQIYVQAVGTAPPAGALPGTGTTGAGGAAGTAGAGGAAGGGVSLNSASAAELTTLPGVGNATAAAIIAHREANGPFTSVDGLMDVRGIGPAKFDALRDLVTL